MSPRNNVPALQLIQPFATANNSSPSREEPEPSIGHSPGHKEVIEAELTETGPAVQGRPQEGHVEASRSGTCYSTSAPSTLAEMTPGLFPTYCFTITQLSPVYKGLMSSALLLLSMAINNS